MQQFFQNLQGKIWALLVRLFEIATDFSLSVWEKIKPFFEKFIDFLGNIFDYVLGLFSLLGNYAGAAFTYLNSRYNLLKPLVEEFLQEQTYWSYAIYLALLLIVFFCLSMIRHTAKNEEWRKAWIFFILLSGPIGAVFYYVFRKIKADRNQKHQEDLMRGFFSPMNRKQG